MRNRLPYFTLIVVLFYFFNIANYSFFSYTYSGAHLPSVLSGTLASLRLPLAVIPAALLIFNKIRIKSLQAVINSNWDLLALAILSFFSALLTPNSTFVLLYSTWFFSITVVFCAWLASQSGLIWFDRILVLAKFFIYPNIIVVPLLLIKIKDVFTQDFEMAFSSKNFYAYSLLILFIGIHIILFLKRRYKKEKSLKDDFLFRIPNVIYILILVAIVFFVLVSGRRSPTIAIFFALLMFYYLFFDANIFSRIISISIILASIVYFASIASSIFENYSELSTLDRLAKISVDDSKLTELNSNSFGERQQIWSTYLEVFKDYPLFGVGPGNAANIHEIKFSNLSIAGYSPHNTYLSLLVEFGLIGIGLLIIIFFRNTFLILKMTREARFIYIIFTISVLFINYFEYNSSPGQILFFPFLMTFFWPRLTLIR